MKSKEYKKITINGLWKNNPALVQILGLCPLLAVSNSAINALGLGVATVFVLTFTNFLVSISRKFLRPEIRIAIFVLLIASGVTIVESLIQAYAYPLYQTLGIYLPLIVTNCVIIARAESFAAKNPLLSSTYDGFIMGIGFLWVIFLLGSLRELLATGKILSGADKLFGQKIDLTITIFHPDHQMIITLLPAGAFLVYALLIAFKNWLDQKFKK